MCTNFGNLRTQHKGCRMPLAACPPQPLKKGTLSVVGSAVRIGSLRLSFIEMALVGGGLD